MRKNEGKREMEKESSCHNNNHNRIYVKWFIQFIHKIRLCITKPLDISYNWFSNKFNNKKIIEEFKGTIEERLYDIVI